jgi:hypothetical protein
MHKLRYRFRFAPLLLGMLLPGQGLACALPPGFVAPPRPEIAPLESLLRHTEEIDVARPFAAPAPNRPLEEAIRPTRDLPGVAGTLRLLDTGYGSVGSRRLVCLTDGSTAVEEVLLTEASDDSRRFRYVVWNYTSPKFRDVDYAVGEILSTRSASGDTRVSWTYRFAPKRGLGTEGRHRFRKVFLEQQFAAWMRTQLESGRKHAEAGLRHQR